MYIFIANSHLEKIIDFDWNVDFIFNYAHEDPEKFVYLSNIDPYWMTIFNKWQIEKSLLKEIESIDKSHEQINKFITFIKNIEQHDLLVIVWD